MWHLCLAWEEPSEEKVSLREVGVATAEEGVGVATVKSKCRGAQAGGCLMSLKNFF